MKKIIGINQKCPHMFSRGTRKALTIDSVSRLRESFNTDEKKYLGNIPINDNER